MYVSLTEHYEFFLLQEDYSLSYHECSEGLVFHPELDTCVFAGMYPECVVTEPPVCHCDCFYPAEDCSSYYYCKNSSDYYLHYLLLSILPHILKEKRA